MAYWLGNEVAWAIEEAQRPSYSRVNQKKVAIEDEIAKFLTKTERKESKNTQIILLNACYLLFEEYLHEKKNNLYLDLETMAKNKPKFRRSNMDEP